MMFGRKNSEMVDPSDALPGRPEIMPVHETHAVLGTSVRGPWDEAYEVLSVGMGCFWGAERIFWQIPGVHVTAVGYQGGHTPNPTYQEVCSGRTGHTEAVAIVYDPAQVSLDTLFAAFWENHDPTEGMRQGNDTGTQYRSAIYTTTDGQLSAAKTSLDRYQEKLAASGFGEITTEIAPASEAGEFFYAEDYHQGYLQKNPGGYCNHGFCQVSYAE